MSDVLERLRRANPVTAGTQPAPPLAVVRESLPARPASGSPRRRAGRAVRRTGVAALLLAGLATGLVVAVVIGSLHHGARRAAGETPQITPAHVSRPTARANACVSQLLGGERTRPGPGGTAGARLRSRLAVFRRPAHAQDVSPAARCVARSEDVPLADVRYVGRGLLGGEVFEFLLPHGRDGSPIPAPDAAPGMSGEPAACLTTVGAPPIAGQVMTCASLGQLITPTTHWGAGQILPGPGGARTFARYHVAAFLRHGSLLGGVVRDGIATIEVYSRSRRLMTIAVHDNAAYFHVDEGASAAVYLRLVYRDRRGRVVRSNDR